MQVQALAISEIKIFRPQKHGDGRGFFSETYNKRTLARLGLDLDFVQDNHSLSSAVGTLRGIHYQGRPFVQNKLVRVVSGRIFDVAVDIRRSSPTFGEWVSAEVSAAAWNQMFVPAGFAHAICTLEPDTQLIYKVTDYYAPQADFGIRWNDPDLNIAWPFPDERLVLSDKDRALPLFKDVVHWL